MGALTAIVMLTINPLVTVGTLPTPADCVCRPSLGNLAERYRKTGRETTSDVTGFIADMFQNTEAIKALGAEERVINHFREVNGKRKQRWFRIG